MPSLLNSRRNAYRSLCWLMSLLMATAPSIAICAEPTAKDYEPLNLEYVSQNAAGLIALRPQQLLTCETVQMLPVEVLTAASLQELGFDPVNVKQIVLSATPPMPGPFEYAAVIELTKPIDLGTLSQKLTAHTEEAELNGKPYLKSNHPMLPSFYWVAETTLLLAPDALLEQLLSKELSEPGAIAKELLASNSQDDLLITLNLDKLRPLIQMGLFKATEELPPEAQPFLEIPNRLRKIEAKLSLSGTAPSELLAFANNAEDADRISELIDQALEMYADATAMGAASMIASDDPVEQAMGKYVLRTTPAWAEHFTPDREGEQFTIFHVNPSDGNAGGLTSIAIIGTLVGLLLPAVQAAREAARRNASMNNMKNIMLALHNYADRNGGRFPAHASYDAQGEPLLSWRVHILPELEQIELYRQFHLDEPWDSEHNLKLIPQMPEFFLDPSSAHSPEQGKTHYLGAKGPGFMFDGTAKGKHFAAIRDGSSNTIMILQVNDNRVATWTKPEDWELNPKHPLEGLAGSMHPGGFLVGFADAHIEYISEEIDTNIFQQLITIAGGEVINREDY